MTAIKVRQSGAWVDSSKTAKAWVAGAWVDYGPANSGVSLFTAQVPDNPDFSEITPVSLGTAIQFGVPGSITHVTRRWPLTVTSEVVTAAVFSNTGTKLSPVTDASFSSPVSGVWCAAQLATPVPVTAGQILVPAIRTPEGRYAVSNTGTTPGGALFPLVNGQLSAAQDAGRFSSGDAGGVVNYPDSSFHNGCYFIDVIFVPS